MTGPTVELPEQRPEDPRGWLTFVTPVPNDLQNAEDATQELDVRTGPHWRPATPTERHLLAALGYPVPAAAAALSTRVEFVGVRRRTWPSIEKTIADNTIEGNT